MYDIQNLTITSTHPCLVIYLLDQSGSMGEIFGNANHSKALEVANAINENIFDIALRCNEHGQIKNRFEISVIGYGRTSNGVQSGWEGQLFGKWVVSISNVFNHPLRTDDNRLVWVNPYSGDNTPMTKAFENAKRLCKDWIEWGNHRECHPPIIINITDGEATDAGYNFENLLSEINQIKSLSTYYGNVKIFNIHISKNSGDRILFPSSMNFYDKYQKLLFDISTELDSNMIRIAQSKNYNIESGAKGYVFNGTAHDLINFLNIGTPL